MFQDADKFLKIAIGLGALAAGAGIGYHFGVLLPEVERQKIEIEKQAQERDAQREIQREKALKEKEKSLEEKNVARKEKYDACVATAYERHQRDWAFNCQSFGMDGKAKGCTLPTYIANPLLDELRSGKEGCLNEFKSGILG